VLSNIKTKFLKVIYVVDKALGCGVTKIRHKLEFAIQVVGTKF
jgi:hypothetical protein